MTTPPSGPSRRGPEPSRGRGRVRPQPVEEDAPTLRPGQLDRSGGPGQVPPAPAPARPEQRAAPTPMEVRQERMAEGQRLRATGQRRTVTLPVPVQAVRSTKGGAAAALRASARGGERVRTTWFGGLLSWVSPLGWSVLALGTAAVVVGLLLAWVEVVTLGVALLVACALCFALAVGRTHPRVELTARPSRVRVGERAAAEVVLHNPGHRRILPSRVEIAVGEDVRTIDLPALRRGEQVRHELPVPTDRRGVVEVGPVRTVQEDPLRLTNRTRVFGEVKQLFVHPSTRPLESGAHGLLRDLEGEVTPELSMADINFHALREYEPGDDRRYVHWRSSAKHDRLLVRQFQETRRAHLTVIVDVDPSGYRAEEDVEAAMDVAASLVVQSIRDEQEATVVAGDRVASRTTIPLTLDTIAQAGVGRADLLSSARRAAALAPDSSVVVLVTGPRRAFLELQQVLFQFDVEVHHVALLVDGGASASLRRQRGMTIATVGGLDELHHVLSGLSTA